MVYFSVGFNVDFYVKIIFCDLFGEFDYLIDSIGYYNNELNDGK